MRQLTQTLKDGAMSVSEVPLPALTAGCVLVRVHYSAISAGTEGKTVRDARLNLLAKAGARQKEVGQVLDSIRTRGLSTTYKLVMNKLEALAPLGYSLAGEIIAVGSSVTDLKVGDRVACAGATASHAEVVAVPRKLCVRVPDAVDLREAAFTTIAAIALQGIRQSELALGSNCVVIGQGLIGLLTTQLLRAGGVRVAGIDVSSDAVERCRRAGADLAFERSAPGLEEAVNQFTAGHGTDAVIITAATASLDPVELAGRLCRRKGKVVVVGGVPTGFSREHYYRKELDLRMSCSYGPGRYDPSYEEDGHDYPIGYVRWTENRNMQTYIDLLSAGRLDVGGLITHEFELSNAPAAYQLILERTEPFIGVLLRYDTTRPLRTQPVGFRTPVPAIGAGNVGVVGAGSFAQNVLLPALQHHARLVGVATARGNTARSVGERFGFEYCTGDAAQIFNDPSIDTVFIATPHGSHATYALQALRAGKHVFVEKPLCITLAELEQISAAYYEAGRHLIVGFNRRFAPLVETLRSHLPQGVPAAVNYRINAGPIERDHWVHDPSAGGGRILGEACHFIDLASYLACSPIRSVTATPMHDAHALQDTMAITLAFENGGTAAISYFSNGNNSVAKEYLEVFAAGQIAILDDFRHLTIHGESRERFKSGHGDKGHREEVRRFMQAVRAGTATPIPYRDIDHTMLATFAVLESARCGRPVILADMQA